MRRIAVVGISIILVASACGSNGDAADSATSSDTEAQTSEASSQDPLSSDARATDEALLVQAVEGYVAAFGNGDPDAAVSFLSERCSDTIPMTDYRASVAAAGELYPGLVVDDFYDIVLDDDRAVVFYSTDPEVETEDGERWIIESGAWVWDDC